MTDPFLIRALVPNYEAIREAYRQRSDATRAALRHHLDLQYGPHPDERLDLFLPDRAEGAPVHIFVHGGYWRANVKEDYAYIAEPIVAAGGIAAIVEYTLMPKVRLATLVDQVRRAARWLVAQAGAFGGDAGRLSASGHSAGGHLAFYLAAAAPHEAELPDIPLQSLLLVSGLYDLDPITRSFLQPELGLTSEEVAEWSPVAARVANGMRFELAVGEVESAPFHAQAERLAVRLSGQGSTIEQRMIDGADHMSIVLDLGTRGTKLGGMLEKCVGG
ncbi:hypothetical protein JP74_09280 [Devosia sp. 17-2-E-8]|nr:hypothetical protein JP74_09280 [Devosia sp. 17-2-E-8]